MFMIVGNPCDRWQSVLLHPVRTKGNIIKTIYQSIEGMRYTPSRSQCQSSTRSTSRTQVQIPHEAPHRTHAGLYTKNNPACPTHVGLSPRPDGRLVLPLMARQRAPRGEA